MPERWGGAKILDFMCVCGGGGGGGGIGRCVTECVRVFVTISAVGDHITYITTGLSKMGRGKPYYAPPPHFNVWMWRGAPAPCSPPICSDPC